MIAETIPAIDELSPEEQLILSSELWERHASPPLDPSTKGAILDFLKKSRESYLRNPDAVITLDDLKEKYRRETE